MCAKNKDLILNGRVTKKKVYGLYEVLELSINVKRVVT